MGKVILSCSGSGGTGKTTFAVNISAAAAKQGLSVLLLDLNMGRRNADIYLGMEDRILFDLGDVVSGLCRLDKAIISHDLCPGLSLLSCPQYREIEGISAGHVNALYRTLRSRFDLVVVDCPVSVTGLLRVFASGADAALMLTVPDFSAVRNAEALCEKLEEIGIKEIYYAINRIDRQYTDSNNVPGINFITRSINAPLVGMVSEDPLIHIANNSGIPVAFADGSDIARRFADIASRITA